MDDLKRVSEALELALINNSPNKDNEIAKQLIDVGWDFKDEHLSYKDFIRTRIKKALKELDSFMEKLQSENKRLREALKIINKTTLHKRDSLDAALLMISILQNIAQAALQDKE